MRLLDCIFMRSRDREILDELTMKAIVLFREGNRFELGVTLNAVRNLTDQMSNGEEIFERLKLLHSALPPQKKEG